MNTHITDRQTEELAQTPKNSPLQAIIHIKNFINKKKYFLLIFLLLLVPVNLPNLNAQADSGEELVIGVAEWRHEGGPVTDWQQAAYEQLQTALEPLALDGVQIIKIPVALDTARDVDRVAEDYDVNMILWGWYDEVATRSYVDLADATQDDGLTNSLDAFLEHGGSPHAVRVLLILSKFDYVESGLYFCVPRWTP